YIINNFLYNDLLPVRLAWEYTENNDLDGLLRLDTLLSASKSAMEIRKAGVKLGARFSKILDTVLTGRRMYDLFIEAARAGKCGGNYSVMFGLAAKLFEIGKSEVLYAFTYSTASSIINNCAKLVPISQRDGQKILFSIHKVLKNAVLKVQTLDESDVGICCFGFDLRSMQHERLYTRLYIS
ncbi:MAG TPA: urease accessory UreF family protein, partial [Clostridia bacterium]